MIALFFAAALQGQQPTCEQVLVTSTEQASVTLTGFVGRDLRHNYLWISDFGCGAEQQILLFFRDDVKATPEGRRAIEAIDSTDIEAIREGRLHVPNTGLRVRAVGHVARNSTLRQLNLESLELLESPQ